MCEGTACFSSRAQIPDDYCAYLSEKSVSAEGMEPLPFTHIRSTHCYKDMCIDTLNIFLILLQALYKNKQVTLIIRDSCKYFLLVRQSGFLQEVVLFTRFHVNSSWLFLRRSANTDLLVKECRARGVVTSPCLCARLQPSIQLIYATAELTVLIVIRRPAELQVVSVSRCKSWK